MPFGRILVVDDDPLGLKVFKLALEKGGFEVDTAMNVPQAINKLQGRGMSHYEAVVTDYQMPGENGIDLLEWIKGADISLSVIIITSQKERQVIQDSLRHGASDFIEKPVGLELLKEAVRKACQQTQDKREARKTQKNVKAIARMNQFFKSLLVNDMLPYLELHYTPNDMVGGDFVNVLPFGENQALMLVGDVSGHDLRAGFVSAYFQGLVRGLSHNRRNIVSVAESFNKILLQEWTRHKESLNPFELEPRTTLSLLAVLINYDTNTATILNCGAPNLKIVRKDGSVEKIVSQNPPLGWSSDDRIQSESLNLDDVNFIFMGTDGVHDWAHQLGMNSLGLEYNILNQKITPDGTPPDDLLMLRYQHNRKLDQSNYMHPLVGLSQEDLEDIKKAAIYLSETLYTTIQKRVSPANFEKLLQKIPQPIIGGGIAILTGNEELYLRAKEKEGRVTEISLKDFIEKD